LDEWKRSERGWEMSVNGLVSGRRKGWKRKGRIRWREKIILKLLLLLLFLLRQIISCCSAAAVVIFIIAPGGLSTAAIAAVPAATLVL
jgi:hypothetical protein